MILITAHYCYYGCHLVFLCIVFQNLCLPVSGIGRHLFGHGTLWNHYGGGLNISATHPCRRAIWQHIELFRADFNLFTEPCGTLWLFPVGLYADLYSRSRVWVEHRWSVLHLGLRDLLMAGATPLLWAYQPPNQTGCHSSHHQGPHREPLLVFIREQHWRRSSHYTPKKKVALVEIFASLGGSQSVPPRTSDEDHRRGFAGNNLILT